MQSLCAYVQPSRDNLDALRCRPIGQPPKRRVDAAPNNERTDQVATITNSKNTKFSKTPETSRSPPREEA
jgi:hypothetical protein